MDEALVAVGATAPPAQRAEVVARIAAAWDRKGRTFHDGRYLAQVLERLEMLEEATTEPAALQLAAALRGALEGPGWEETVGHRSLPPIPALVDLEDLRALGIPAGGVQRIDALVDQLSTHRPAREDVGAKILVDADLGALAVPPQEYKELLGRLRNEVAHLSEADFLLARRAVLLRLLGRDQLFVTPVASQWEDVARINLEAELATTDRKLGELDFRTGDPEQEGDPALAAGEAAASPVGMQTLDEEAEPALATEVDADSPVADTSTLESVADLIDRRGPHPR